MAGKNFIKKILVLISSILLYSNKVGSEILTLKIASIAPEESFWGQIYTKFKNALDEMCGGKLKVIHYAGGVMGDEPDLIRKMKTGQIHGAALTELGLTSIVPQTRLLNMVLFYRNYEEWDLVRMKLFRDFQKLAEEKGFVLIGWTEVGGVRFFSKRKLTTLEEIKNARFWAWAGDPFVELMAKEGLGVSPIILTFTEVLQGLQTGMIDTFYGPPYAILALQWFKEVKYISTMVAGYVSGGTVITKKFFDSLDPKTQEAIFRAWEKVFPELRDGVRELDRKTYEEFIKMGMEPVTMEEKDIKILEERSSNLNRKVAEMVNGVEVFNKIISLLEESRKSKPSGSHH